MAEKRVKTLSEAEIDERYSPPTFNPQDQRFFFSLNDIEIRAMQKVRERRNKCMFVVLLGYFKSRPITIIPKLIGQSLLKENKQDHLIKMSLIYFSRLP